MCVCVTVLRWLWAHYGHNAAMAAEALVAVCMAADVAGLRQLLLQTLLLLLLARHEHM